MLIDNVTLLCDFLADIIKLIVPGAIIAILSALITVRLAIRRFHEEKWWEKKVESYTSIFEVLHRFKIYVSQHYDQQILRDRSEKQMGALEKEWRTTSREYARLRDLASFYLSKEALAILKAYENRKSKIRSEENDRFRRIEDDLEAVGECLKKLKEAAKKDLKIR